MNLHWIDLSILAALTLSMVTGFIRGFVKEVIALCVWIASLWIAFHYYTVIDSPLAPYISDANIRKILCFLILLITSLVAGGLFNALLSFILKRTGLSGMDRILGMAFGFGRGIFIISLVMLVINTTVSDAKIYSENSKLYNKFSPVVSWINNYTPDLLHQIQVVDNIKLNELIDLSSDLQEG